MASVDDQGDSCLDDDYSDCSDDETSLGGWLVGDDVVEYMDALDHYLGDDDDDEPLQQPKKRRLVRAEPETDDEDEPQPVYRNKKWIVDDEDEAVAVAVA